ncbi:hypothetical protein [Holospora curviuscula]|uniref:Uncharacterized protein n=1 Tax=Holospora curviuscula TaxID=1082868 RepID=A0A2S5R9J4_9PROT|nr:hypothetical protein [Holospora curviuscula]PPE03999.1 hypothetical protein HCUR_00534 [Holospora curviuscula]
MKSNIIYLQNIHTWGKDYPPQLRVNYYDLIKSQYINNPQQKEEDTFS